MTRDTSATYKAFLDISAQIGSDIMLIQGAGGNTSIKLTGNKMAIKASGKLLADAGRGDVFVSVDPQMIARSVQRGDPVVPEGAILDASGLRPSIETTLHALMPHRVVIHTHSVRTIAHAIWDNSQDLFAQRLNGLNWASVPYSKPGPKLTQRVEEALANGTADVLVILNHGLVVGAETPEDAFSLMNEVETRLDVPWRNCPAVIQRAKDEVPEGFSLSQSTLARKFANCPEAISIATGGSLYPDHVVFLGSGLGKATDLADAVGQLHHVDSDPRAARAVVIPKLGIVHHDWMSRGARAMIDAICLVALCQTDGDGIRYLSEDAENELLNWEAEAYRRTLATSGD